MTTPAAVPAPARIRRRIRLVARALLDLARLERPVRTRTLPRLCTDAGVSFAGFRPPDEPPRPPPLPREIADAWWAVDLALRAWPWARDRPCLRRSLLLGRHLAHLGPTLLLEVVRLRPLTTHAVLVVHGHRLDMGALDPGADITSTASTDEDR